MDVAFSDLLSQLQSCDECQWIEAKESREALGKSALETISSFSNEPGLGGGYFVFGLRKVFENEEKRYVVKGVSNPDKVQQELVNVCRNAFNKPIDPRISVHRHEGKTVIVAFIPEAFCRDKPIAIKSLGVERGAFRRIGSADYRCTEDDLDLLYQLRRGQNYESEVLSDVTWEDISSEAIEAYRRLRSRLDGKAQELELDDQELLLSLKVAVRKEGKVVPTVGGLLLFGTKMALRREMPMAARVDYIVVEGTEWVEDPSERYQFAMEYRESLVTLMPRLYTEIMNDIPSKFRLETGNLQRTDIPLIPRDVIREATANSLMHRDYRPHQPTQIIRYSNRLEFKNAGYSLKPIEELGQSGSQTRNPIIASVFHELKHAETKGTGIRSMKKWMLEAGLTTPPIIESERDRNLFDLILLPHHLLDQETMEWLSLFKEMELSDAERRALAFTRKVGAITNQDYRQLNGTDTLSASAALRRLRGKELLIQKGKGSGTYYKLGSKALEIELAPQTSSQYEGLTPHISSQYEGLTPHINPLSGKLEGLSKELKQRLSSLNKRTAQEEIRELIRNVCSLGPLRLKELAKIFNRNPRYLRNYHLSKMIEEKELVYLYPEQTAHPLQAYCVPKNDRPLA